MQPLKIVVIEGTSREGRESIHVARLVAAVGRGIKGVEVELVDPLKFVLEGDGNNKDAHHPEYARLTAEADAFFIVTPEYNHSFPGSLKRLLDSELANYIHKPVAFAGCSSGRWGGVRAIEALVTSVREMGLVATFTDVQFPNVQELFDLKGELIDPIYRKLVERAYGELIWMAKTMQWGRQNLPRP